VLAGQSLREGTSTEASRMNMTQPEFARFVLSESLKSAADIKAVGFQSQ